MVEFSCLYIRFSKKIYKLIFKYIEQISEEQYIDCTNNSNTEGLNIRYNASIDLHGGSVNLDSSNRITIFNGIAPLLPGSLASAYMFFISLHLNNITTIVQSDQDLRGSLFKKLVHAIWK
jgi:hypothetical protein